MKRPHSNCPGITRRSFLADTGLGFTGLALGAMLFRDGVARADGGLRQAHFPPKAKSVIWIFLCGGVSHLESFDVKPELNKYAGKSIDETPYKDVLDPKKVEKNIIGPNPAHGNRKVIMPLQTGSKRYGESGLLVGDWFQNIGGCADDLAVIRSLWTIHNDHGAQLTWQTGRHPRELDHPTLGSWVCYGLGSLNDDLPQFVVMGTPLADCCGGMAGHGGNYLGPEHNGVQLNVDPKDPLPYAAPGPDVYREEQQGEFELLGKLNRLAAVEYPADQAAKARIKSYELAFRMQMAVPDVLAFERETAATHASYGLGNPTTAPFGQQCLAARRLVERGVRFVQIFHGSNGGAGAWDAHGNLKAGHTALCAQVDQPIAALIQDLKRRGLLDETLVVWGTEFGRTPGTQGSDGRDHHPYGFSIWLAGGGIKGGIAHGATDELAFHAVEQRHYVTDLHATVLNQLGLDSRRLEIPGRKRLDLEHGQVIREILA